MSRLQDLLKIINREGKSTIIDIVVEKINAKELLDVYENAASDKYL
jgi:hypothetical protein